MFFSPFLASRYLKPKRTFVSIITVISILGVVLGVWLLMVVIAVFTGYGERIKESVLGFEPHLTVQSGGYLENWEEGYQTLNETEGVEYVTPYVTGQVLMRYQDTQFASVIRGILPPPPPDGESGESGEEWKRLQFLIDSEPDPAFPDDPEKAIARGEFDISDPYKAVIGAGIAEGMDIQVGDRLLLYAPSNLQKIMETLDRAEKTENEEEKADLFAHIREMTFPQEVEVTGIFKSGWQFDYNTIFVHLETAQVLYDFDLEQAHGLGVRTDDGFKANRYKAAIEKKFPEHFLVLTWNQMHEGMFKAVAAERQAMYLILCMVMLVAGFCIMNTMITVTYQKRSEIGLLKALGAREAQVVWVFVFQGMVVGVLGVLLGLALAQLTIYFRHDISAWVGETFGVDIFSEEAYQQDGGLPAKQTLRDFLFISGFSFAACTLSALIPAVIAANLQPAKALRSE